MAGAVEAGKGFVRIFTDLSPMEKGLKQIEAKMKSFGSGLSNVGGGIAGIGLAATAIGTTALGGITALATRFAGLGDTLSKASDRTGITASSLSELGYAAEQSGTDLNTVEKSVAKMQKSIIGAAGGSKSMAKAFASVGLSAEQLSKLSPEQQFLTVGKAIARIEDPTMRAAKAMEIFGKSGTELLPMLTSDIEALRQEARDLGVVISDEDAKNATDLGDSFDRVKKSLGGIATQIGAAVAKPLTLIANTVAGIIGRVSAWVATNRSIVQTIAAVAAGFVVVGGILTAVGVAIIGIGATISALGAIIGGVVSVATAAFGAIAAAVGFILSPVGLVVAAVVGIGVYAAYAALTATQGLGKLSEMFGTLGSTATTAWGGIVAAISTGDLETAGQIAFTALEIAWLTVTTTMKEVWGSVTDFFRNIWLNVVESIVQAGASIYFGVAKYFDQLSNALVAGFDIAVTYIVGAIDSIQTAIAKAIIKAQQFFGMFSAEESVQIQASLDEDFNRRASGRQRGLDSRAADRGTALSQRDTQRRATAEQFSEIVGEDFNRRRSVTSVDRSGIAAARQRMADLQVTLSSKAAEAQTKAAEAQAKGADKAKEEADFAIKTESGGSSGSFVGGIAASIAGGGVSPMEEIGKQQLDVMSEMNQRVKELVDAGGLE